MPFARRAALGAALWIAACAGEPDAPYADLVVAVGEETFAVRTTRAGVAARARKSLAGRRRAPLSGAEADGRSSQRSTA